MNLNIVYVQHIQSFQNPLFLLFLAFSLCILSGCSQSKTSFENDIILNGNIDDRQVNLTFLISERIEKITVEEGTLVKKGDLLGNLETVRIQNQVAESEAEVEAAKAGVSACEASVTAASAAVQANSAAVAAAEAELMKTMNGNRKEDIAIAEAAVEIFRAQITAAENLCERNRKLSVGTRAVSEQDCDNAEANFKKLLAEQNLAEENLTKLRNGSRQEEKDLAKAQRDQAAAQSTQAEAQLAQARARLKEAKAVLSRAEVLLKIQKQRLADCQLLAPCDGIIRNRILEPGEMASPQTIALTLAPVSPKWVRVYLNETLLPMIKSGDVAEIRIDGLPNTVFNGWVGFISPSAEFTPKNVETAELRTSLVYEVRVYVQDPQNILKLGAPATVTFPKKLPQDPKKVPEK